MSQFSFVKKKAQNKQQQQQTPQVDEQPKIDLPKTKPSFSFIKKNQHHKEQTPMQNTSIASQQQQQPQQQKPSLDSLLTDDLLLTQPQVTTSQVKDNPLNNEMNNKMQVTNINIAGQGNNFFEMEDTIQNTNQINNDINNNNISININENTKGFALFNDMAEIPQTASSTLTTGNSNSSNNNTVDKKESSKKTFSFVKKKKTPKTQTIQNELLPQQQQQQQPQQQPSLTSNININNNIPINNNTNTLLNSFGDEPQISLTNISNHQESNNNYIQHEPQDEIDLHLSKEEPPIINPEPEQDQDQDHSEDNFSISSKSKSKNISQYKIESTDFQPFIQETLTIEPTMTTTILPSTSSSSHLPPHKPLLTKESVQDQYNLLLHTTKNNYITFISNIHCLKLKLKSKGDELIRLRKETDRLHQEEQIAVEEEHFDKAGNIENTIQEYNLKISEVNNIINQSLKELLTLRENELNLMNTSIHEIQNIHSNFNTLKTEIEDKIKSFHNKELAEHKSENIKLQKLNEKLQYMKSDLDQEKNFIDNEESKINELIKGQSKDIFDDLDNLNQEKQKLNTSILELKKQLEQKENELEQLNTQIQNKEIEIDAIKSNFNHDFNKIENKKKHYKESLKDYDEQLNTYNTNLETYNNTDISYENHLNNLNIELTNYEKDISNINELLLQKQQTLNNKKQLLQKENEIDSLLCSYEEQVNTLQKKITQNKNETQNLIVNNKNMQIEITQIEIKVPGLEEEKKAAVRVKNFKEAGRVNKELKASLEKISTYKAVIENNKNNINKCGKELEELEMKINQLQNEKDEHKKELNIAKYEHLVDHLQTLKSYTDDNRPNGDLIDEIRLTNEEINKLMGFDYIKERIDKENEVNDNDGGNNNNENNTNGLLVDFDGYTNNNNIIETETQYNNIDNDIINTNNEQHNEIEEIQLTKEEIEQKIKELTIQVEAASNVSTIHLQ